jgi:hypothetical protein
MAMPGASLSTKPAVARDTPAAAATSRSVTLLELIVTLRIRFPVSPYRPALPARVGRRRRKAAGTTPVTETIPTRLFTKQNIGTIQVTTTAQAPGAWFGDDSFESAFTSRWGVG